MGQDLNHGGMLPSTIALKDSLNQKPNASLDPTMLAPCQLELLGRLDDELDDYLDQRQRPK